MMNAENLSRAGFAYALVYSETRFRLFSSEARFYTMCLRFCFFYRFH